MHSEDEKEDESPFVDTQWLQYAVYVLAVVLLGFIILYVASFYPIYDVVADSLRQTAIFIGFMIIAFCVIKLITYDLFSAIPPDLDNYDAEEPPIEVELNPLPSKLKSAKEKNMGGVAVEDILPEIKSPKPRKQHVSPSDHPNKQFKASPINETKPLRFTAQLLEEVEWLRFEKLCSVYFTEMGLKNRLTGLGADGGVDINIFDNHFSEVIALVQCKKVSKPVSVKLMREFYGVMVSQNISKGYFITSSTFYKGAITFAKDLNIELIDGRSLLGRINDLSTSAQRRIVNVATLGDYKTASCVKCGTKMKKRLNQQTKKNFWSCPKSNCNTTMHIKN